MRSASGEVAALAEEFQRKSEEIFLGDKRFTNVILWDDSDFKVHVQSTFTIPEQSVGERHREVITYHHSENEYPLYKIEYKWAEIDEENNDYTKRETVLHEEKLIGIKNCPE